ncbi:MAG TPA: ABC transporter substrate-binding protein [Dissulfurispiraceae bacterium]|nr:ABC transporter substrate-binding protein [Dissulfurispiraceae bacterium]
MIRFFVSLSCAVAMFVAIAAHGKAEAGEATEQIKATVDQVIEITKDKNLKKPSRAAERRAAIRRVVLERFDFTEMAKRSLAVYWQQRTAQERKEFIPLFTDLLERSYIKKVEGYNDEKILYSDERRDDNYAVVKTKIITKRNVEIPIDYKLMLQGGGRWEVYDISIEGVSLVNNYRTQFAKIIRTSSYQELVKRMKSKQQEETFEEKS